MEYINFGVIEDPRSEELKAQDYQHKDLACGTVVWTHKEIKDLKSYTKRNQNGSLSCCMQGAAKGIETITGKVMSAISYLFRQNFPSGGMFTQDIGRICKNIGLCLESEMNSQNLHESEMNSVVVDREKLIYKVKGYAFPDCKNIDEIAQAIETWGHCGLIFHANGNEWKGKPVFNNKPINFGHKICGVDYFLDEHDNKCIWIEDSATLTTTLDGQHRIITEVYLKARCSSAIYFLGVNPLELPFKFTETLRLGSRGLQVKQLQKKLGLTQDGIFGRMTQNAVKVYQLAHDLVSDGICGKLTMAELNK